MDKTRIFLIGIIIILAGTSTWLGYVTATSAPSQNLTCEPGGCNTPQGSCTDTVWLDGTTPIDTVVAGSQIVGTAGQDMGTFMPTIYSNGHKFCFKPQIFTFQTTWNPAGGMTNVIFQGSGEATVWTLSSGTARAIINSGPLTNVTFSDMTFDGNGANQVDAASRTIGELVILTSASNLHTSFLNVYCRNAHQGACIDFGGQDLLVFSSHFINNGVGVTSFTADHLHIQSVQSIRVIGNYFNNCTDTALAQDNVSFSTVAGNTFIDAKGQLLTFTSSGGGPSTNSTVLDNTFSQTHYLGAGINVDQFGGGTPTANGISITGNVFNNGQSGAYSLIKFRNANRISFTGNNINSASNDVNSYALVVNTVTGFVAIGNQWLNIISGSAGKDILLQGVNAFNIEGDLFRTAVTGIEFATIQSTTGVIAEVTFNVVNNPILYTFGPASTVRVSTNIGYNPVGTTANAFSAGPCTICSVGLWNGTIATPVASTVYRAIGTDMVIQSTGGTGVSISIIDNTGANVATGLTSLTAFRLPWNWRINFGAFSVAPTVTVFGT